MKAVSKTLRLKSDAPGDVAHAASILREGGTVAFPTETVYGLGANALDTAAVAGIFAAKQRPAWDPLIVHVADFAQLKDVVDIPAELSMRVSALAAAFWPGPLTLLLPRGGRIPDAVTAGRPLAGVRIPAHPVARELLRRVDLPIAAPSANTFGHTSPTTAAHVLADLDGRIDAVLDGGATRVGVESTVLDPAAMVVYRPGAVTLDQIAAVCGASAELYVAVAKTEPPDSLPAPGVGLRHYAPHAKVILTGGSERFLHDALDAVPDAEFAGVMLPRGWRLQRAAKVFDWGEWGDPAELAATLFAGLRELDDSGVHRILCPLPAGGGMNDAIRDRLQKAAREA